MLKNPFFFGITVAGCACIQVWISYLSGYSILEGDLIPGFFLFLTVPALGLMLVFYYLWFRRQRISAKTPPPPAA